MPVKTKKKRKPQLKKVKPTRRGNCYVTCEALYHLLGGSAAGYTPFTVRHEGDVHWYLVLDLATHHGMHGFQFGLGHSSPSFVINGRHVSTRFVIIDPTASQFKTPPPYDKGRGRGFLTAAPSKRAKELMDKLVWQ